MFVSDAAVQPCDGVTFRGSPGYGSAFDETPGELEVVVCDACLDERCQRVVRVVTTHTVTARREGWDPDTLG
ncbi:hypothetical protein [Actinomadura sp. CNU-125]|uniref:hypothetical protein n=1 Tax=Actinomadura sp. CNU-125 TaxID=1904961 RepID=UPI001177A143|nr:hypothetical protein [Actinomadura sp. CNU-125]